MSLQEFLNKNTGISDQITEVTLGERFKDENGEDYAFKIKPVKSKELSRYKRECTKGKKGDIDGFELASKIVINHTIEPSFRDSASFEETNCVTPEQYLNETLLAGEVLRLHEKILDISGLNTSIEELRDEVKN